MTIPTLSELQQSIRSDLRNKLQISTVLGKVVVNAIALVQAAKLKLYYLRLDFVYKNIFPDQASSEDLGGSLSRLGYLKLGRFPSAAIAGEYLVSVAGSIGATIAPGTTFVSNDNSTSPSKIFTLDSAFTFTATTGQIKIRALEAGVNSILEVDDTLQVTQPLANVNSFATVLNEVTTPYASEDLETYRSEIIQAYRLEAQGGAKADIRLWSLDADGVRSVYPYTSERNIVNVYVEATVADSTDGYGTPSSAIITDVEDVIEFDPDTTKTTYERGRRPMSMYTVNVLPITLLDVDIVITDLSDTSYITAIENAVIALLYDIRPFISGLDLVADSQQGVIYESDIYGIVKEILGVSATFTSLTLSIDSTLQTRYEFTGSNIPKLNSVTNV